MASKIKEKPKKRGDAHATRTKIIEIATLLFAARGYEAVGVREIASQAGVTAAMINRYFGTKEGLFLELMGDAFSFTPFMDGNRNDFGQKMATIFLQPYGPFANRNVEESHFKMLQIVLRSATSNGAPPQIQAFLDKQLWCPLIHWLGGKNPHERAELIVATLIGFVLMNKKVSSPSQKKSQATILTSLLANALQRYVDGEP